jgi:DNA-nicking Smr family endonuclease
MDDESVELPIGPELDLHTFHPRDIPDVVADYLDACAARGLRSVRLVHGRGKGVQRAVIRRLLASRPDVEAYADSTPEDGGWGATRVWLRARPESDACS